MALSRYFNGFLVCVALTAIQGCSTDGSVCLFVHRGALFQASANGVKTIGPVGRDAFLDPAGSLSWTVVSPKTEGDDSSGPSVEVHRLDSKGRLALLRRFDFPKGHYIRTTAMAGGILFVTGKLGDCTLGLYDTRSPNPVFSPVELPEQVKRKAFDDLIIDGKSLLAVDNVIMPKWLVHYDISDPAKPKPTEVTELMAGLNEHVVRGVVGTKYLALFSQSMWDGGESQDVQIYDKSKAFAPQAKICLWSKLSDFLDPQRRAEGNVVSQAELFYIHGYRSDPQMSFAGDLLLLAGYGEGVGVLDCSAGHAQNALPGRLFYRDADGKDIPVLDAVGLPSGRRVAVWLHQGKAPVVVETNMLICRPSTEKSQQ